MAKELYRLTLSGNHTSEYWQNDLFFEGDNLSAGDVIHNAKDLLSNFLNNAMGPYLDLLPSTVYLNRIVTCRQDVAGGVQIVHQFDYQGAQGTISGEASSQQLCPIVRLIPPMNTKSAGRFFLPAAAEQEFEANAPTSTWLVLLSAFMNILLSGMSDGAITWTLAIYSRKNQSYTIAQDYDTSPIIGWQRRRQRPF